MPKARCCLEEAIRDGHEEVVLEAEKNASTTEIGASSTVAATSPSTSATTTCLAISPIAVADEPADGSTALEDVLAEHAAESYITCPTSLVAAASYPAIPRTNAAVGY